MIIFKKLLKYGKPMILLYRNEIWKLTISLNYPCLVGSE